MHNWKVPGTVPIVVPYPTHVPIHTFPPPTGRALMAWSVMTCVAVSRLNTADAEEKGTTERKREAKQRAKGAK